MYNIWYLLCKYLWNTQHFRVSNAVYLESCNITVVVQVRTVWQF